MRPLRKFEEFLEGVAQTGGGREVVTCFNWRIDN